MTNEGDSRPPGARGAFRPSRQAGSDGQTWIAGLLRSQTARAIALLILGAILGLAGPALATHQALEASREVGGDRFNPLYHEYASAYRWLGTALAFVAAYRLTAASRAGSSHKDHDEARG